MAEPFKTKKWGLWVQPDGPNTTLHYLGCHTLDDVEAGGGGINELIRRFKPDGAGWKVLGSTSNPPDPVTTTVTGLIETAADWLERILEEANCPFPLYVNGKTCPPYDVFGGAARWYALEHAEIGTSTLMGLSHREEDNVSEQAFEITAWPPVLRGRAVTTERIGFTGEENLNDVTGCSTPSCAGDCDAAVKTCDMMVAVADADPAAADVWISFDNGVTWTAAITDPYVGLTTDLKSVVCFPVDADTTRILVAREGVAGMPAHVYYSDDDGANWTDVTVGGTHDYGAVYGGALFALDMYHIWYVTTDGANGSEMWFSDDGGETWTEQTLADDTQFYYAVWFADEDLGMVVGASDAVEVTTGGGTTWGAGTATGGGNDLYCVNENAGGDLWWTGDSGGALWYSDDQGTTWAQRGFPGDDAGAVYDLEFATQTVGWMIHSPTNATGRLYRTRNGGLTWELESATVAGELYSVHACSINKAFAVGETDTTAIVLKSHD
jgi:photosystem II stability/assembly factor-like uncharacterized protein